MQRRVAKIYSLFSVSLGKRLNSNLISSLQEEKVTSTNENVYSREEKQKNNQRPEAAVRHSQIEKKVDNKV